MLEVEVLAEDWRIEYKSFRPHGSMDFRTPETFRAEWLPKERDNQPQLS